MDAFDIKIYQNGIPSKKSQSFMDIPWHSPTSKNFLKHTFRVTEGMSQKTRIFPGGEHQNPPHARKRD